MLHSGRNWSHYAWQFNKCIQGNSNLEILKSQHSPRNYGNLREPAVVSDKIQINVQEEKGSDIDLTTDDFIISGTTMNISNVGSDTAVIIGNLPRDRTETSLSSFMPPDGSNDNISDLNGNLNQSTISNRLGLDNNGNVKIPTFLNIDTSSNNGFSSISTNINSNKTSSAVSSFPLSEYSLLKLNNSATIATSSLGYKLENIMVNGITGLSNCTVINVIDVVNKDYQIQEMEKLNPLKRAAASIVNKFSSVHPVIGSSMAPSPNSNTISDPKQAAMTVNDPVERRNNCWKNIDSAIQSELKSWMGTWLLMKPEYLSISKMKEEGRTLADLFLIEPNNRECVLKITDVIILFMMNRSRDGPTIDLLQLGYHYTLHIAFRKNFSAIQAKDFFGIDWNRDIRGNINTGGFRHYDDLLFHSIIKDNNIVINGDINDMDAINYDKVKYFRTNPMTPVSDRITMGYMFPCNQSFLNMGELMALGFSLSDQTYHNGSINNGNNNLSIDDELLSEEWENDLQVNSVDSYSTNTNNGNTNLVSPNYGYFNKKHFLSMSLRGNITYEQWGALSLNKEIAAKLKLTTLDLIALGWPKHARAELDLKIVRMKQVIPPVAHPVVHIDNKPDHNINDNVTDQNHTTYNIGTETQNTGQNSAPVQINNGNTVRENFKNTNSQYYTYQIPEPVNTGYHHPTPNVNYNSNTYRNTQLVSHQMYNPSAVNKNTDYNIPPTEHQYPMLATQRSIQGNRNPTQQSSYNINNAHRPENTKKSLFSGSNNINQEYFVEQNITSNHVQRNEKQVQTNITNNISNTEIATNRKSIFDKIEYKPDTQPVSMMSRPVPIHLGNNMVYYPPQTVIANNYQQQQQQQQKNTNGLGAKKSILQNYK